MARFEHRYAGLIYQDGDKNAPWAQFTPEERMGDEGREVRYGVLETDDEDTVKRLREMAKRDKDLREVKQERSKGAQSSESGVPDGNIADVLAWVGDDADRARQALDAERAKGDRARSTLVADLEQIAEK